MFLTDSPPDVPPAPALDLPSILFFGRSFTEYCQFFALDPAALRKRPVLDVAAGPASFTAEACRLGIDAVAVDPLYGCTVDALSAHVQLDYAEMGRAQRRQPALSRFTGGAACDAEIPRAASGRFGFPSFAAAERDRRAAAQRFLEDYRAHFAHGRYFGAALPQLPFFDRTFDVVLCAHLLFVYARQLDYAFHLAACRELVRVSRDDVRIHPVCGADGQPYQHLPRLIQDLARASVDARVVPVNYEFFRGSASMLVLTRTGNN
jgi:hypothetical protein